MEEEKQIQLFLVDSDPELQSHVKSLLMLDEEALPYSLQVRKTLVDSLEYIKASPTDVVLLSLDLQDSHGFDTNDRLHDAQPTVPIIVIASSREDDVEREVIRRGLQNYLVKDDLDHYQLWRFIRYALMRQRVLQG